MIYGILDGMVMQRGGDNTCEIWLKSDEQINNISTNDGQQARIERCGQEYKITGILCGGPYVINIDGHLFNNIYVGDVWLLAGQSNMQGCGRDTDIEYNSNPCIRAFYMNNEWKIANNPLHEPGRAFYQVHTAELKAKVGFSKGNVGPGLYFAKRMYDLTSVPQGIICCAHADTSLEQWNPDRMADGPDKSLYAAMIERVKINGFNIKGLFWAQGCNDSKITCFENYTKNTVYLFKRIREDVRSCIPIVYMQLSRCLYSGESDVIRADTWNSVQEQQRVLHRYINNIDVIPTSACKLTDRYHLSAEAHKAFGKSAAESMFCLINGMLYGCLTSIKLESVEYYADENSPNELSTIILTYKNVKGELNGGVRPLGFSVSENCSGEFYENIISCETSGNRVNILVGVPADKLKKMYLSYGKGFNPPCNIVDKEQRSLPVFGHFLINEIGNRI